MLKKEIWLGSLYQKIFFARPDSMHITILRCMENAPFLELYFKFHLRGCIPRGKRGLGDHNRVKRTAVFLEEQGDPPDRMLVGVRVRTDRHLYHECFSRLD